MALLQITEPGAAAAAPALALGVDLGTSNSLVATMVGGAPRIIKDADGRQSLPSAVRYGADGVAQVGAAVLDAAAADPHNCLISIKRFMGRSRADCQGRSPYEMAGDGDEMVRLVTAAGEISPVQVAAEILQTLAGRALAQLGRAPDGVVITVPAYFDDAQRQATRDAAAIAGLRLLRLINEPTAAALAYGTGRDEGSRIAVYDLGGGTFDISLLQRQSGLMEVLATGGDTALGGDDMDACVAAWMVEQSDAPPRDAHQRRALLTAARRAREQLSDGERAQIDWGGWRGHLERAALDELIAPLIERTMAATRRALEDAGLQPDQLDDVLLVGGATRTPAVRDAVAALFGRAPRHGIDPDLVVAMGAAMQADVLVGNGGAGQTLLLDVLPLSLGLEVGDGLVEPVIARNSGIPVVREQTFTTQRDGQTAIAFHIMQGEGERVADCRSLARFELRGLAPMPAGRARIKVSFQVDADGLLGVRAADADSGARASVAVQPSYGLSAERIKELLGANRAQSPAQQYDGRMAEARQLLQKHGASLDGQQRARLDAAMERGRKLAASEAPDADALAAVMDEITALSAPLAAAHLEQLGQDALAQQQEQ